MLAVTQYRGTNAIDYTNLRVMGVPIEIGPVVYPWGSFPEHG